MNPFLYRCPSTGMLVQGWHADDGSTSDGEDNYVGMHCLACNRMHFVNPAKGSVLGADKDSD